jgi:hypothetical protein
MPSETNPAPITAKRDKAQPQPWAFPLQTGSAVSGLSIATLRRREKEGRLRFYRVGGRTLVCAKSLRELLGMPDTS